MLVNSKVNYTSKNNDQKHMKEKDARVKVIKSRLSHNKQPLLHHEIGSVALLFQINEHR